MKILVQHIENLLPGNDCVVVPGLGGFVQNEVTARIQPGARLFYPASKELGFNQRLKFNDGLLAQSYQESNGMSFEDANVEIQKAVQEINEKLAAGKFIRLGRIGTLFMVEQQLVFRPDHHNHFYPEAYGLTPFTFPLLNPPAKQEAPEPAATTKHAAKKEAVQSQAEPKVKASRDEFIHIRFNRSRARQLMVGAAVFLMLILISKPAGKPSGNQEAGMMHNYLSVRTQEKPVAVKDETSTDKVLPNKDSALTEPKTHAAVPTPGIQKEAVQSTPSSAENNATNGTYYVVVSTFVQKATAQRWIKEHEGESFIKDAAIVEGNGRARVFIKSTSDPKEASRFLNEFAASHPEYASAWVYSAKID